MAFVVPNDGELRLLTDLLQAGAREDWALKLYRTNVTPAETDTAATYTEANFTNYVAGGKTLTRAIGASNWVLTQGSPTASWSAEANVAKASYGSSAQSWTCGTPTTNTIYGYYIVGGTSGTIVCAELFATAKPLSNGDSISLTPAMELA